MEPGLYLLWYLNSTYLEEGALPPVEPGLCLEERALLLVIPGLYLEEGALPLVGPSF